MEFLLRIWISIFIGTVLMVPVAAQQTGESDSVQHHDGHEQLSAGPISGHSLFHLDSMWLNHDAVAKTLSQALSGKPTVGAIIYTSCEHACPMIVNDMLKIERQLGNAAQDVQFALFSMDVARDTPEKLKLYRTDKQIGQWDLYVPKDHGSELELAVALGIRIKALANGEFAHSNVIFVLDSEGIPVHQQNGLGLSPNDSVLAVQQNMVQ